MKQLFKGVTLTLTKTVNNILAVYNRSNESFANDWYKEANEYAWHLAVMNDVPHSVACGVLAALSPIKTWEQNKLIANVFLATGKCKHTKLFEGKAKAIVAIGDNPEQIADILHGRKITAFFLNILNPECSNVLTIDRHALSIALGYSVTDGQYRGITATQYAFMVSAYTLAAKKAKISPIMMQSTTWQAWRQEKGIIEAALENEYVPY